MRLLVLAFFAAACAAAPPPPVAPPARSPRVDVHADPSACGACHPSGRGPKLWLDPVAQCVQCHPIRQGDHPVGGIVAEPRPDLPLDPSGRVVCHSCHEKHEVHRTRGGLLRPFNDLCVQCHRGHR